MGNAWMRLLRPLPCSPSRESSTRNYYSWTLTRLFSLTRNSRIYSLITIPFDIEKPELMSIWYSYMNHVTGRPDEPRYYTLEQIQNKIRSMNSHDDIEKLEALFKSEDLIFQCVKRFDYDKDKLEETMKCKDLISEKVNTILATQKFGRRKCPKCGRELKWNFPYPMCDMCHEKEMTYRYFYNDY